MNKNNIYYRLIVMTARQLVIAMSLNAVLSVALWAKDGYSQDLENCRVSIDVQDADLPKIFSSIEEQTSFKFVYNEQVGQIGSVTLHAVNEPLLKVLMQLKQIASVRFKQINNTIAIAPNYPPPPPAPHPLAPHPPPPPPPLLVKENILIPNFSVLPQTIEAPPITGKVVDETGAPMPGVNVVEKGTGNGTVTDADGKFTLSVSSADAILQFSFVGFKSQEISAGGRTMLDVTLTTDVSDLKEVVVTGYTSERKQDLVSAVSQVSGKETVAIPQSDIGQALQGRVAGVQVTTSGQPGTQSQVRIRGFGSFGNNSPLYVIDGVPTFDYTNINPYDVESQTVLKDAGAASIYGARAASGVIIITTKHGKYDGKTNVSLDMSTSVSMRGNGVDALNPQQQANKVYEALRNTPGANSSSVNKAYGTDLNNPILPDYINVGVPGKGNVGNVFNGDPRIATALANYNIDPSKGQIIQVVAANKSGTDWYKALTRTAPVSRISLGLSSGSERAHYYANFSYLDQQGVTLNQYLKRWNLRLNSEFKPIKNVRIGENVLLTYKSNPTFRTAGASPIDAAYSMPSIIPIYDVKGNWAGTAAPGFNNPKNPVATVTRLSPQYNQQNASQIFGNLYIEADLFKHVTLRSSFGGEIDQWQSLQLLQQTYENSENSAANMLTEASSHSLNYTFTNTLRYENNFGKSTWKGLLGYEAIKNNMGRMLSGSGLNPFSLDPDYLNLSNTSSVGRQLSSSHFQPYAFTGVFAKVDYSWDDKYYLSSTIRRDGSSVFSPANRYGVFPSISGAWRISAEKFMSNA